MWILFLEFSSLACLSTCNREWPAGGSRGRGADLTPGAAQPSWVLEAWEPGESLESWTCLLPPSRCARSRSGESGQSVSGRRGLAMSRAVTFDLTYQPPPPTQQPELALPPNLEALSAAEWAPSPPAPIAARPPRAPLHVVIGRQPCRSVHSSPPPNSSSGRRVLGRRDLGAGGGDRAGPPRRPVQRPL